MMKKQTILALVLVLTAATAVVAQDKKWTAKKANDWYAKQGWVSGCNFQPSNAINQLEMFQKETFDKVTLDRELKWASDLGFTTMRVFLHHILWTTDKEGFKSRLNEYLAISSKHGIKTMFVFFDDCWNDTYAPGKQPEPKPGVHNSGWVRDPGTMIYTHPDTLVVLEKYVKDIMTTFAKDERILLWDLYNEPGNNKQHEKSLPLLKSVFGWAREVNPSQPISAGVWNWGPAFKELNEFQLENSDVVTYHQYGYIEKHKGIIEDLKKHGRPLICTEYMARRNGSLFQVIMPMLKENKVGAINWGFVAGKTNTIFAWDTPIASGAEPELWFHDILRKDGTPYSPAEVQVIKAVNGKTAAPKKK